MTKKDYIKFAEMLNDLKFGGDKLTKKQNVLFEVIVEKITNIFSSDNGSFSRERFESAINKNE